MMKLTSVASAAALGLTLALTAPAVLAQTSAPAATQPAAAAEKPVAAVAPRLYAAMQDLWHGHIVATRDYALAVHAGDKKAEEAAEKAEVANGHQIADAVAGFYGKEAGEDTFKALSGHVAGVNALTLAIKAGNKEAEDKAMKDLTANAAAIAKFFAAANPKNWTEPALDSALMMHVGDHKMQLELMMSNAPQKEQDAAWTHMQEHMDMIADALSQGLVAQFPSKVH